MRRLAALVLGLTVALGSFPAGATAQQGPQSPAVQAVVAKNVEYNRYYQAKDYVGALRALDQMAALGREANLQDVVAGALYNKACVLALAGRTKEAIAAARESVAAGYTNYMQFLSDTDLDSLRRHPQFVLLMKDLHERYLPPPLQWDAARTVAAFDVKFDAPDDPRLAAMRREFDIDPVVASSADDYARLRALTAWVSKQFPHSTSHMASRGDPVTILREARAGGSFICREYAIVVAGVAPAYGLPARVLNLAPREVERSSASHSVAEVWLPQFGKWVLADGQFGTIAELHGVPLNAVELQAAIAREDPGLRCAVGQARCEEWKAFIAGNLYYLKFAQDQRRFDTAPGAQLVLVPRGAPDPHKYNGGDESVFAGSVYVSDPGIFYRKPF